MSLLAADLDAARKCWRNFAAKQMGALFDPKSADPRLAALLTRAADVPDLTTLDAFLAETEAKVRRCFTRILGRAP